MDLTLNPTDGKTSLYPHSGRAKFQDMGKLISSPILPSVVNAGRYLYNFHSSFSSSVNPFATRIQALCKKSVSLRRVSTANEFLRKMLASGQVPNTVTCSILLNGLCKTGKLEEALKFFQAMRNNRLELNIVSYNILIDGLCKAGHIDVAKELFYKLSEKGLKPDVYTYTIMINGFSKERFSDEAYQLFRSMRDNDCLSNSCCYNVMIQGLLRNNCNSKATQLLAEMLHVSAANPMSFLFLKLKRLEIVLKDFNKNKFGELPRRVRDEKVELEQL
ncbi:hypothetical protein V6N13_013069 [Hibiscus sabdariffa]